MVVGIPPIRPDGYSLRSSACRAHVVADDEVHAHDVVVLLVTNGQRFAGLDGAAVLEHGAVGCRQGGYLAEYFVHTVPVDGVVDMLERVNIRATQGKWCLGTIDVRPGEPWAPLEPVVFGGAAETCDAVIGETGRRQGVFVHADPEPFGFDAAAGGSLQLHTHAAPPGGKRCAPPVKGDVAG